MPGRLRRLTCMHTRHVAFAAALALAAALTAAPRPAAAEAAPAGPTAAGVSSSVAAGTNLSVEGDVTWLALGSLSFHVMVRPAAIPRLRVGVGRVGGALPKLFHTLFDPNEGWSVTEQGGAAQAFFHLRERGSTFFAGAYARFDRWEWRREDAAGSDTGAQLFVMPAAGYRWFPTRTGLFVTPWAGLGVSVWSTGRGRVGEHMYEPLRLFPIVAVHVGYEG
jgi:hypothetical protein